jgi:hypothetical protein
VLLIPGLSLIAFAGGSGRGWGVPPIVLHAVGFYFVCVLWGIILGALIRISIVLMARPGRRTASWQTAADQPIRLFRSKQRVAPPLGRVPSGNRKRLWPWLVGVPVLFLLAAAFVNGVFVGRWVDNRLTAAIAEADRDDPSWRLNDLMANLDPVPDVENSAIVVADALSRLPENWPAGPTPRPGAPKPPPTEAEKVWDRLTRTADNVRLDDASANALRDVLKANDEAAQIARTVADYARGRHELELGPTLLDTPLSETQASRTAARLLRADAAIRAHDGDLDGALGSCRAILGVGRSIGDEPFLISQLARISIGVVAMRSACRVLAQGEPSDWALARLQDVVLDEFDQPLLLYGLRGERAISTELIRRVGAGEIPIGALGDTDSKFDPDGTRTAVSPWGKLWFDNQLAVELEWTNEAVAIARLPAAARHSLWESWQANIDRVKHSRTGFYTATLPLLLTPALASSSKAHSRYESELGAMAILLAAERHRRKTGDWPLSIGVIDPVILPSTPLDPFSGDPFHMERRDGQILIYSIGPNGKDERGACDPKPWREGVPDDVSVIAWDVPQRRYSPTP